MLPKPKFKQKQTTEVLKRIAIARVKTNTRSNHLVLSSNPPNVQCEVTKYLLKKFLRGKKSKKTFQN